MQKNKDVKILFESLHCQTNIYHIMGACKKYNIFTLENTLHLIKTLDLLIKPPLITPLASCKATSQVIQRSLSVVITYGVLGNNITIGEVALKCVGSNSLSKNKNTIL